MSQFKAIFEAKIVTIFKEIMKGKQPFSGWGKNPTGLSVTFRTTEKYKIEILFNGKIRILSHGKIKKRKEACTKCWRALSVGERCRPAFFRFSVGQYLENKI